MEEIFKNIDGYIFYQISNTGRVKSTFFKKDKFLSISLDSKKRYLLTWLCENRIRKAKLVHRLVATAFVPNPLNLPEVNHKDGNKQNNNNWNLEWSTRSDNEKHAHRIGLKVSRKGKDSPVSVKVGQYLNGKLIKYFNLIADAIKEGFSGTCIYQSISTGCLHKGYEWKYLEENKNKIRKNPKPICSHINGNVIKIYNNQLEMVRDGFWVSNIYKCLKNPELKYKKLYWKYA